MNEKQFSISEALKYGFNTTIKHWTQLLLVYIIYLSALLVAIGLPISFVVRTYFKNIAQQIPSLSISEPAAQMKIVIQSMTWKISFITIALALVFLAFWILFFAGFGAGLIKMLLKLHDTGKVYIKELFSSFNLAFSAAGLGIIMFFILVPAFLLLIIPGVYLTVRWLFSYYFLVDQKATIIESIKMSWATTRDRFWQLFKLFLGSGLISIILSLFTQGIIGFLKYYKLSVFVISGANFVLGAIGFLVGIAYVLALIYVYRRLTGTHEHEVLD